MTKQTINVGTTANDKKGDSLRAAFQKVNSNFTELYTALGLAADVNLNLGAFEFNGSVMTTTDSTAITIAQDVTLTSNLNISGDIIPSGNLISNLGSSTNKFHSIYVGTGSVYLGDARLSLENGRISSNVGFDLTDSVGIVNGTVSYDDVTNKPTIPTDLGDLTDSQGLLHQNDRLVAGQNDELEVVLENNGTITTPLLLPKLFTAVLDTDHMVTPIALSDVPWEFVVEFQVNPDGTVQTMIGNNTPWFTNPGYVDGYTFEYTEADHGIPGYTFTLEMYDVINPGGAGWTTNLAATEPPIYPATVKSLGAIKLTSNDQSLTFGTDGSLTYQGTESDLTFTNQIGMESALIWRGGLGAAINNLDTHLVIATNHNNTTQTWQFGHDGNLTTPNDGAVKQNNSYVRTVNSSSVPIGVSTVVWSSVENYISSVKLFIQVECDEIGDSTGWHSQVCEAIIASRGYGNGISGYGDPDISVYGVTYTSTQPLVTFTAQRNSTTNVIEVVALTTAAANSTAYIKIHSTEMTTRD